jgi:hypothetical protein
MFLFDTIIRSRKLHDNLKIKKKLKKKIISADVIMFLLKLTTRVEWR